MRRRRKLFDASFCHWYRRKPRVLSSLHMAEQFLGMVCIVFWKVVMCPNNIWILTRYFDIQGGVQINKLCCYMAGFSLAFCISWTDVLIVVIGKGVMDNSKFFLLGFSLFVADTYIDNKRLMILYFRSNRFSFLFFSFFFWNIWKVKIRAYSIACHNNKLQQIYPFLWWFGPIPKHALFDTKAELVN